MSHCFGKKEFSTDLFPESGTVNPDMQLLRRHRQPYPTFATAERIIVGTRAG
jgi:hypothetical protein